MKKLLVCVALAGTLLFAGTASVFASGTAHSSHAAHNKTCIQETGNVQGKSITYGTCYMDDGIKGCEEHGSSCRFIDKDGDGICDNNYDDDSGNCYSEPGTESHHSEGSYHNEGGRHHSESSHHGHSFRDGEGYRK